MKMSPIFRFVLAAFLILAGGGRPGAAAPAGAAPVQSLAGPLIVDHTAVEHYADIPPEYIARVKTLWLNVPGESHSRGYRNGLMYLEALDSRFQVNVTNSGAPEAYTDQYLRISSATRNAYGGWSWSYGEANWYTNASAITNTKTHLDYANTHDLQIAAMGFGWCWDMTWHNSPTGTVDSVFQVHWAGSSEGGPDGDRAWGLDAGDEALTGNRVTMDTYLAATQAYVDYALTQGYTTTVLFTTGPVDGYSGESGYQRHLKHEHIRDYVLNSSNLVLFDYADILSWNDAGAQNLQSWTDHAGRVQQYQMIHPDNMLNLDPPQGDPNQDDHIGERGALRLAKALWWMLARLSGWDGTPGGTPDLSPSVKTVSSPVAGLGDRLTYTLTVRNQAGPVAATALLTDVLPAGLTYVPGTLQATSGTPDDGAAPVLRWAGALSPTSVITLTFATTVTTAGPAWLTNVMTISAPGATPVARSATTQVGVFSALYLPLVRR